MLQLWTNVITWTLSVKTCHTRLFNWRPPPRLKLSCCCCGDMLSIQPSDAPRLTARHSSGDTGETQIPLISSVSRRQIPCQHKSVKKSLKTFTSKARKRKVAFEEAKTTSRKQTQLTHRFVSSHLQWKAVLRSTFCLDYHLLCLLLMRLYAQMGGAPTRCEK